MNLVAFPGEELNLHIFEPRYRQMVHDCSQDSTAFILCPKNNNDLYDLGTLMEITEVSKTYDNGTMDIKTRGIGLVRMVATYQTIYGKLYQGGEIDILPWEDSSHPQLNQEVIAAIEKLYAYMRLELNPKPNHIDFRSYQLAHKIGLSYAQELAFLRLYTETERLEFILDHIHKILPTVKQVYDMKSKVSMNGHFKSEY